MTYSVENARKHLDGCYGGEHIELTTADIEELKNGKVIYLTVNGGEYAVALTAKEKNVKVKFKYDD